MKSLGIVLVVIGIVMIVIRGFSVTTEKNVVDAGPIKIDKKENRWIGWPTYTGVVLAALGVILIVSDKKSRV